MNRPRGAGRSADFDTPLVRLRGRDRSRRVQRARCQLGLSMPAHQISVRRTSRVHTRERRRGHAFGNEGDPRADSRH